VAEPFARWFHFFDALTVRLEGDLHSGAARGFARKFAAYAIDRDPGRVDLTFRVGAFAPRRNSEVRVFNDYRVGPGCLSRTRRYKIAEWQYDIAGLDGERWVIRLHGNAAAHAMMHHLTMTPWLSLAFSVRGYVPVHAAAAVHPDDPTHSILLAGRRGVGKTTLMGRLLRQGFHVVSEDRVFIKDGTTYAWRVPVNLKFDRNDPQLAKLPRDVRRRLRAKALLSKATRGYLSLHEPIDPRKLLGEKLVASCALRRVVYLQSGPSLTVEPAHAGDTARRIILGNRFEDPATAEDLLAYRYDAGKLAGRAEDVYAADETALRAQLASPGVTLKKITMPVSPSESQWDRVVREVLA
jgi:hypothetical protein